MSALPKLYLSPHDYIAQERLADYKSEYYDGEIFAMAGASRYHNAVAPSINAILYNHLLPKGCDVYGSDMRVFVERTPIRGKSLYTYPDLTVVCGEPTFTDEHEDTLTNPLLIVEILSDSTERYDRTTKFQLYKGLQSFREYVLVAQKEPFVEVFTRKANGDWVYTAANDMEAGIYLESIDLMLPLAAVYAQARRLEGFNQKADDDIDRAGEGDSTSDSTSDSATDSSTEFAV
jgi:Uma2 family endonuclease